jgi:cell division protein FtsB
MNRPKDPPLISGTQFMAIIVLTIAIFMIIDFGRRTTTAYYVSQAEEQLEADIQAELAKREKLLKRRDEVSKDEYVEQWAREEAHWVRSGDRPFILVESSASQGQGSAEQPAPSEAASPNVPNWYHWWKLFFDMEPWKL